MIDLHVHLRGTISPSKAKELALRNNQPLRHKILELEGYGWYDFTSFLNAYDDVASLIVTASDLEDVAYDYLARAAGLGVSYVEFMLSPPDLMRIGVPFNDQLAALSAARTRALESHKIECRMIATAVRHLGPDSALGAAQIAVDRSDDILVGFGLTGDERQFKIRDFAEAFRIARSEGLLATAHAGEHLGPETIIEAIEELGLSRVGHGVRAVESPSVVRQLAEAGIPLEVCLSSNLALGLYPSLEAHPIRSLYEAGCEITLGTDDPAFFRTDIAQEYSMAANALRIADSRERITECSIRSAFCNEETKEKLRLVRNEGTNLMITNANVNPILLVD